MENTCGCVLGPWPWPRAFLSLTSRGSVLGKAVLGLGLGFFLCPWPWPRALCSRLHLCHFVITTQQAAMGKGKRYSTRDSLSFVEEIPKKSVKELIDEAVALLRSEYDQEIWLSRQKLVK